MMPAAMPNALRVALPTHMPTAVPNAMHVRTYGRTNERSTYGERSTYWSVTRALAYGDFDGLGCRAVLAALAGGAA